MAWHHLLLAIKNLFRARNYHIIGVTGSVIGVSLIIIISAWVIQELSYDRFLDHSSSIFMITTDIKDNQGDFNRFPETPPPLASGLLENVPGITASSHFIYLYGGREITILDRNFKETGIAADPSFFDVFSFELIDGSAVSLDQPGSIFITEHLASKLFSYIDPIGKDLIYKGTIPLTVRGILRDIPENSSLKFDYIISYKLEADNPNEWWQLSDATFIRISEEKELAKVYESVQSFFREHISDDQYSLGMIPITDLRLNATFDFFNVEHGNKKLLITLSMVAILILILICLNYTNLQTAHTFKRAKEIMVRKVNGATSRQIIAQFLSESIVISLFVWGLASLLSILLADILAEILDADLAISHIYQSILIWAPVSIMSFGLISGIFPAFFATSLHVIKTSMVPRVIHNHKLKNSYVLVQFILSISLTIICLGIWQQIRFIENYNVGYSRANIIELQPGKVSAEKLGVLKNQLLADPNVLEASLATRSPVNLSPLFTTEDWHWEGLSDNAYTSVYRIYTDEGYSRVFDLELSSGVFFNTDQNFNQLLINEKFAELIGSEEPIGTIVTQGENQYRIVGILKNFNFQHMGNTIKPLALLYSDSKPDLFLKVNHITENDLDRMIKLTESITGRFVSYSIVASEFDELYGNENSMIQALLIFTVIAVLLSCMGMAGIMSFNIESKTKEIAIRKVNGARTGEMVFLLNKGTARWFLIGFGISGVVAWLAINRWMNNFVFRADITWWIFIAGALIVLVINLMVVSMQTWRAATQNPVKALRFE